MQLFVQPPNSFLVIPKYQLEIGVLGGDGTTPMRALTKTSTFPF